MKTSNYRVIPLPSEIAAAARREAQAGAPDHAVVTVDSSTGYPCRHCLQWAQPGEQVVLFSYASIPSGQPYAKTDEYPENFRRHRVLRAYNSDNDMIDAVVVSDDQPEAVIEKLLQNPETVFLQARSVTRG